VGVFAACWLSVVVLRTLHGYWLDVLLEGLGGRGEPVEMQVDVCSVSMRDGMSVFISGGIKLPKRTGMMNSATHPSIEISLRSPPKYLAYSLEIGRP
jgi:hypothetical protein